MLKGAVELTHAVRDVPLPEGARFISAGIHPWYLTREDYPRQLEWVVSMLNDRRVMHWVKPDWASGVIRRLMRGWKTFRLLLCFGKRARGFRY